MERQGSGLVADIRVLLGQGRPKDQRHYLRVEGPRPSREEMLGIGLAGGRCHGNGPRDGEVEVMDSQSEEFNVEIVRQLHQSTTSNAGPREHPSINVAMNKHSKGRKKRPDAGFAPLGCPLPVRFPSLGMYFMSNLEAPPRQNFDDFPSMI